MPTIESWNVNPREIGPMYPLAGYEVIMFVICVVLWIGFTVWQLNAEGARYRQEEADLKQSGDLTRAIGEGE